jgi:hypothetical protein
MTPAQLRKLDHQLTEYLKAMTKGLGRRKRRGHGPVRHAIVPAKLAISRRPHPMRNAQNELESCGSIFLEELGEPTTNGLRVIVAEGMTAPAAQAMELGGARLDGLHAVSPTPQSRRFELQWEQYVAYCVVNESYTDVPDEHSVSDSGRLLRCYSRSRFLSYVAADTLANTLATGPLHHYCLACEDQVVHVVALRPPRVFRLDSGR